MKLKLSKRSWKWGYYWTNSPVQTEHGLGFDVPDTIPTKDSRMTMAAIQRERECVGRINNGNDWAEALYWDGKRLKCLNDCPLSWDMSEALFTLGFYKAIDIEMV